MGRLSYCYRRCSVLNTIWKYLMCINMLSIRKTYGAVFLVFALSISSFTHILYASAGTKLNCHRMNKLIQLYLEHHITQNEFDQALSRKTLEQYISIIDPAKLLFYQRDLDNILSTYVETLAEDIATDQCQFFKDIRHIYLERLHEATVFIEEFFQKNQVPKIHKEDAATQSDMDYAVNAYYKKRYWQRTLDRQYVLFYHNIPYSRFRDEKIKYYKNMFGRIKEDIKQYMYVKFLKAFASSLDNHSDYYSTNEYHRLTRKMDAKYEGLGIAVAYKNGFHIVDIVPGSPAAKQGDLQIGDVIVGVAQGHKRFVDLSYATSRLEIESLIQGKRGTLVRLKILRQTGSRKQIKIIGIIRDSISLQQINVSGDVYSSVDPANASNIVRVGVIRIPKFYIDAESLMKNTVPKHSTSLDVAIIMHSFVEKGVHSVVLDLRDNAGGELNEGLRLAGMFLPKDTVIVQRNGRGGHKAGKGLAGTEMFFDLPVTTLVNHRTASSAEIVVSALQDHKRSVVVGSSRTFGKGSIQIMRPLGLIMGVMRLSIYKFYSPKGYAIQNRGVTSDIVLSHLDDLNQIGERFSPNALSSGDNLRAASLLDLHYVDSQIVDYLRDLSQDRQQSNVRFQKLNALLANSLHAVDVESHKQINNNVQEYMDYIDKHNQDNLSNPFGLDLHLQEAVNIAADYALILNEQKPLKDYDVFLDDKN